MSIAPSPTTPANGAHASLLDRKLKLADQFSCRALFDQLDAADADLTTYLAQKVELDTRLGFARAGVEDAETLVALHVEGRNEMERKANKLKAIRDDPFYGAAMGELRDVQGCVARIEGDIDSIKRKIRRIERLIDYRISVMRFLSG